LAHTIKTWTPEQTLVSIVPVIRSRVYSIGLVYCLPVLQLQQHSMKQATTGSGSAADPSFPDTAAANADLEARLTGGNTGGAGNAMPNEAQVCS